MRGAGRGVPVTYNRLEADISYARSRQGRAPVGEHIAAQGEASPLLKKKKDQRKIFFQKKILHSFKKFVLGKTKTSLTDVGV